MNVESDHGNRAMTLDCHSGDHHVCTGVSLRAATNELRPTPCECRCHAPADPTLNSRSLDLWNSPR